MILKIVEPVMVVRMDGVEDFPDPVPTCQGEAYERRLDYDVEEVVFTE